MMSKLGSVDSSFKVRRRMTKCVVLPVISGCVLGRVLGGGVKKKERKRASEYVCVYVGVEGMKDEESKMISLCSTFFFCAHGTFIGAAAMDGRM